MRRVTRASSSSPSHPRTPWVLPRWLQGRLARSTAVRFFAVLSRARALRAITQSAPARPRTQRASRNQPMASAKEARNHGADGSRCYGQQRSHPTGWKTVHRLNFLSIGGWYSRSRVNSPSPDGDKRIAARLPSPLKSVAPVLADWPNRSVFPDPVKRVPDQRI
jgi:hypothetical protein